MAETHSSGPSAGGESGAGSIDEAHHELWRVSPEVNATHLALTIVPVFILLLCARARAIAELIASQRHVLVVHQRKTLFVRRRARPR